MALGQTKPKTRRTPSMVAATEPDKGLNRASAARYVRVVPFRQRRYYDFSDPDTLWVSDASAVWARPFCIYRNSLMGQVVASNSWLAA